MKLLGIIDFIAGIVLILGIFFKPIILLVVLGIILLAKSGLGMLQDFASWIDLVGGLSLLLLTMISIPKFILIGIGFLILQKAVVSLIEL